MSRYNLQSTFRFFFIILGSVAIALAIFITPTVATQYSIKELNYYRAILALGGVIIIIGGLVVTEKIVYCLLKKQTIDILLFVQKEIFPSFKNNFSSKHANIWLAFALIIGFGVRDYFMSQPMRYDEAYTFLNFVNQSPARIFYYPLPNNHVLHTIFVKIITSFLGANPITIRLIAFGAGIGCIPLTFNLCRQLKQSGVFAGFAIAIFPYLVLYSTNARGYTLLTLLTLILASVGLQVVKKISNAGVILISLIASLGMMTMPSMLFPIAGLYCWFLILLIINKGDFKIILYKFIIPCCLFTFIFTMVLYTPVIIASHGIETVINNNFVRPQLWSEFLSNLFPHIRDTISSNFRDIPGLLLLAFTILFFLGIFYYVKKRNFSSFFLLPSMLFGSATILFLQHKIPFDRTWIYTIPFIILIADAGFTLIIERVSQRIQKFIFLTMILLSVISARSLISSNTIGMYSDTGFFPEAPIAAKFIKSQITEQGREFVIKSDVPANRPLGFYLWYYDIPVNNTDNYVSPDSIIYVVKKSRYSIQDLTSQATVKLFDMDDMEIYQGIVTK